MMELEHYMNVINPYTEVLICDSESIIIFHGRICDLSGCTLNRIVSYVQLATWPITGSTVMNIVVE